MGTSSDLLMKLRPVTFVYKDEFADGDKSIQYGLIAEEVEKIEPNLVAYDKDGKVYTVFYHKIDAMLLNEVQKQNTINREQQKIIESQNKRIEELEKKLEKLINSINEK